MGVDDLKVGLAGVGLFLPAMATVVTPDMPMWALALKELGSVIAVIYLFYYTLTRAIPSMQRGFEGALREQLLHHTEQMAAERSQSMAMTDRLLSMVEKNAGERTKS